MIEWKEVRLHYCYKGWARDWLTERILGPAVQQGSETVEEICRDMAGNLIEESLEVWERRRMARIQKAAEKKRGFLKKVEKHKRLEKAEMRSLE